MDTNLKLEIQAICSVHLVTIIIAIIFFLIFYLKSNKSYSTNSFLLMQVSIIFWLVFKIFKTVSVNEMFRWGFIVAYYFCTCVFEVSFLEFMYSYFHGHSIKKKIRIILYTIALLQFIVIVSNPMHHLFYSHYDFFSDSFGILFYVNTSIEYLFITSGYYYAYLIFMKKFKSYSLSYKVILALAIMMPLIVNILYITKVFHQLFALIQIPYIFDITPISLVISITLFTYLTFNYDLIKLSPIMKNEIVEKLDTAICVLNSNFEVIYLNKKLADILIIDQQETLNKSFKKIKRNQFENGRLEVNDFSCGPLLFNLSISKISAISETQYLVIIKDISKYLRLENKIIKEQKELNLIKDKLIDTIDELKFKSKIGARNYVAREIHDVIGHSYVITIKLLEVSKLYFNSNHQLSKSAIKDAIVAIDTGVIDISKPNDLNNYFGKDLEIEIKQIFKRIENIEIETKLSFKGLYVAIKPHIFETLIKVIQETITNSLKHSKATMVFISVNLTKTTVNVMIIDNGIGCEKIIYGTGIRGIVARIKELKGRVNFTSDVNEGFMTKIVIDQ